jgi:dephospho-CoA kinase
MGNWPGKYVIGLTGNIATGKSVVRKMLEHLGAYTIDADALAHRAIAKGAPGYKPVREAFGRWVLDSNGQIDRGKLGRLVFNDPEALTMLEEIVHPLVEQAVDFLIQRAGQDVVVIEAIKLLESGLGSDCDAIWVSSAPQDIQLARLMYKRGMSEALAKQRLQSQPPQDEKVAAADVVIQNTGSYDDLWRQVGDAWKDISPAQAAEAETRPTRVPEGEYAVQRGKPRDSRAIAGLITRLSAGRQRMTPEDVMAAFGERAFLLLEKEGKPVGLAGWQVENLVARTLDMYIDPRIPLAPAVEALIREVEHASQDLQCEVSLVFVLPDLARHPETWKKLGYERRTPQTLGIQAWHDAALESMPPGTTMFFKQLRQDRVLRPI